MMNDAFGFTSGPVSRLLSAAAEFASSVLMSQQRQTARLKRRCQETAQQDARCGPKFPPRLQKNKKNWTRYTVLL